jgi:pyruvate/2-oxoglutarate/acetoin dehydrogenase E1 component
MLRDENVFIMGEEVARYNGAYKVCISWEIAMGRHQLISCSDHERVIGQIRGGSSYRRQLILAYFC